MPLQMIPSAVNKGEAQYLFDDKTVNFFEKTIKALGIT